MEELVKETEIERYIEDFFKKEAGKKAVTLKRRIEFHEARIPDRKMEQLKKKYKVVTSDKSELIVKERKRVETRLEKDAEVDSDEEIVDGHEVFPKDKVENGWKKIRAVGMGLNNLGNTCFLNSVLQCLTHTPSLAEYLLTKHHSKGCKLGDNCMVCRMEAQINRSYNTQKGEKSMSPTHIVGRLKSIAKHMRVGRQEDAHEFLRYLIDAMQQNLESNAGIKRGKASETTMIHRVFGGRLRSSVTCLKCGNRSDTVDPCLDISLDVQHASSVAKCFGSFTRPEKLSGANKYKCAHCRTLTDATKQLTISKTPSVLTLQLKRFCAFSSIKIAKFIEFPLILDLQKYVAADSKSEKNSCSYSLYAVLVHSGHSCKSGHYFCYVKSPSGVWYEMNDSLVRPVSVNTVLSQSAYLLFYEKMGPSKTQPPVQPIPAHIAEGKPAATTSTLVNNTSAATLLEDSVSTPVDISTVLTNQSTTPLTKKQKKLLRKLNKNKNKNKNKKKKKSSPSSISIPVSLGKAPTISNAGHWDVSSNSASDRDKILLKLFNEGSNQKVPDSWDVEYDRGKLKKVKSKKKRSMVRPSNPFQLASEIKGS